MLVIASLDPHNSSVTERARVGLRPLDQITPAGARGMQLVTLVTCHRIELVLWLAEANGGWAGTDAKDVLRQLLPAFAVGFIERARVYTGSDAAHHLLQVAAGLESLIPADQQLLGQVRNAYARAAETGLVGAELHRLFQLVLRAGKRVRSETAFGRLGATVGERAAELSLSWLKTRGQRMPARVAVLGAGETARFAATPLVAAGLDVVVLNRTASRAMALAHSIGARAGDYSARYTTLAECDVILLATAAARPAVTSAALAAARGRSSEPLLILDLGMPPNAEAGVADLPGIELRDLDTLCAADPVAPGLGRDEAEAIIAHEGLAFGRWLAGRAERWAAVA